MSTSSDDKLWAALSHGLALLLSGTAIGAILAPLVIYLAKKDSSAFVAEHARESLNFQISMLIYGLALGLLACTIILIPLAVFAAWALGIFYVVIMIVAIIKAASGDAWRYPLSLRLVK